MPKVLPYKLLKYYLNNFRSVPLSPLFLGGAELPSTIKWLKGATNYVNCVVSFSNYNIV